MARPSKTTLRNAGFTQLSELKDNGTVFGWFGEVELDKLQVAEYQRAYDKSHSKKITADFNPHAVGTLSVSWREGRLWACDGQHRLNALLDCGKKSWYANLSFGLSYAQEANVFYLQNTDKAMNGWVKFRAAVAANNVAYTRISEAAKKQKLTMGYEFQNPSEADITSSSMLLYAYEKSGGLPTVEKMLECVKKCYCYRGRVVPDIKHTEFWRGLSRFVQRTHIEGEYTMRTICEILSKNDVSEVIKNARKYTKKKPRPDVVQYYDALMDLLRVNRRAA